MKHTVSFTIMLALLFVFSACSNTDAGKNAAGGNASGKAAEVTVLVGKEEIAKPFEEMVNEYNKSQNKIKVSIIPLAGQNAYEKISTLYASGNAPTIMNIGQEFSSLKDKLLDLSDQEWTKHAAKGTLDYMTSDGKVYGMPMSVEAFGFIYNKKALDKAVGGSFDPSTIKTRDDLKALFDKIKASGVDAVHISPLDWSLGAHFTNIFFTDQSVERDKRHQFLSDLKAGKVNLADNTVYQGWLDTFDLMKQYNSSKDAPLAPQYDEGPQQLTSGKAAMWFMGNWAYPQLKEADPEGQYGFLPVPVSNNSNDYGNNQISASVPSYWAVDGKQASPEQQAGAKDFLNWMVSSEKGQDFYVNQFNFIPAYDNFKTKPKDSLSQSVMKYMDSNKTLEWMNLYYPPDAMTVMGGSLQKYLSGNLDRAGLTKDFQNYWKNVK